MKTFADFLIEAKKRKSDYSKVYAAKVAAAKKRQDYYVNAHKDRVQQALQKEREAQQRKREEEKENQEYISHIEGLKKEIKKEVKKEYGINDDA